MSTVPNNAVHYLVSTNSGKAFIRDLLFPASFASLTKQVAVDAGSRRGIASEFVEPRTISLRSPVDPNSFLARRYGESLEGDYTMEQRRSMGRADVFQIQEDHISRREEFECVAEVLKNCSDISTADFAKSINDHSATMQQACAYLPDTIIFSPDAFKGYVALPATQTILRTLIDEPVLRKPSYDVPSNRDVAFQGFDAQGRELYTYQNYYSDQDGVIRGMLPPGTVILANRIGCRGMRAYGAIEHNEQLIPCTRYTTLETVEGKEIAQTTSAPMMQLGWPKAVKALRLI